MNLCFIGVSFFFVSAHMRIDVTILVFYSENDGFAPDLYSNLFLSLALNAPFSQYLIAILFQEYHLGENWMREKVGSGRKLDL